jgi:hypothetical protein
MDQHAAPLEGATDDPDAPLRLRVLLVLPTHGDVADRAAFEASLEVD